MFFPSPPAEGTRRRFLLCTLYAALGLAGAARAESAGKVTEAPEPQVKAEMLAKLLHYVRWPEKAMPKSGEPITVGFLGDDPVAAAFDVRTSGGALTVNGRTVVIKRSSRPGDLKGCQALFISKSVRLDVKGVVAGLQGSGTLTVSDMDRFLNTGGVVGFRREGSNVRIEIDAGAARKEGLSIVPELLKKYGRKAD